MSDERSGSGFLWFLAGLGIGAAVGVLYAPKSGRETRDSILNAAEQGSEMVRERARQYKEQAQQWVDKGRDVLSQQKETIRSAFDAGRQAYKEATQEPTTDAGTTKL